MPSLEHEAIVELIRAHPSLLAGVLAPAGARASGLVPDDATLSELLPSEYHAHLVLVGDDAVVIVEVQLNVDPDKHVAWPGYVVSARRRHRRTTWLVVVAPSEPVARWAGRGVADGSLTITPLVLGPGAPIEGDASPILAVFFRPENLRAVAIAALAAAIRIDDVDGDRYVYVVLEYIRSRDPALAEELMTSKAIVWPKSPWLERAEREGEARGEARGMVTSLLAILHARGLPVSEADRARIEAADAPTLAQWVERAISAPSVRSLLHG